MGYKILKTLFSSSPKSKARQVCIVGAGPAGFYAAMQLSKKLDSVNIDIIEKLPVPFGLIRYGVAPDHPEVKNVINQFTKVAKQSNVNFYGNICLGRDIYLNQLRQHYDAVLLTYGAEEDKTLGIENEDAKNVIGARNFVGWYNGLPNDKDLKVDLSCRTAAILGQGNVALDVARILLTPIDELKKTDIPEHVISALAESKVNELYLVGRRGPLQVAFTIKELREQLKLRNCQTIWREKDFENVENLVPSLARPRKRLTELMLKSLHENNIHEDNPHTTYFKPIFFRSPNKFLVNDEGRVTGVELNCTKLVGASLDDQKCVPTDQKEILNCNLAFRSIGYKSICADNDLRFSNGLLANNKGVVEDGCKNLAKVYVAGWLGTGPVGVILHTMGNAFQVAKLICDDLCSTDTTSKGGFVEIKKLLTQKDDDIIDWTGWEKIDSYEIEQGKIRGKPREKICCTKQMIEIAKA